MKQNEKRMIAVLIAITIVVIIVFIVRSNNDEDRNTQVEENTVKEEFVEVLEDGTKLNTSSKLEETKKFEGMEISNFQLTEKDNVTLLLGTITNTSSITQGGFPVNVKVVDKEGNEIITVAAYIKELEPGESTQLSTSATFDYANAYDFSISRRK